VLLDEKKNENKKKICEYNFEKKEGEIVILDNAGTIIGSFCNYCLVATDLNPFRNCAKGVKISTVCRDCLKIIDKIDEDNKLKNAEKVLEDSVLGKQLKDKINFDEITKNITNGRETISRICTKYKGTADEIKLVLRQHYGDTLDLPKGKRKLKFVNTEVKTDTQPKTLDQCLDNRIPNVTEEVVPMIETTVTSPPTPKPVKSDPITIDDINHLMEEGINSVSKIAEKLNSNSPKIKTMLMDHYGDRIKFVRGRNGGIKID
jgi:hypothetical protein